GSYRIGALMPDLAANQIVDSPATLQTASGISVVQFLRQVGSATLAMPDTPLNTPGDTVFGPIFTFTPGPPSFSGTVVSPNAYASPGGPTGLNTLVRGTNNPRTYQIQYSAASLGGLPVGQKITEFRLRLDSTSRPVVFPTTNLNWPDYEVTLAQAVNPIF